MSIVVIDTAELIALIDNAVAKRLTPFIGLLKAQPAEDEIIDTKEAAKILGYKSTGSVQRDVTNKKIAPVNGGNGKVGKRGYRFKRSEVKRYADSK